MKPPRTHRRINQLHEAKLFLEANNCTAVREIPAFYGTRMSNIAFIRSHPEQEERNQQPQTLG
jgi:hypothetical protein